MESNIDNPEDQEKNNPEQESSEQEKVNIDEEDAEIEELLENNKEQIKQAAEDWLASEEQSLKNDDKKRLKVLAAIGALAAISLTTIINPGNTPQEIILHMAIAYGISGSIGATAGAISGKVYNFFNRKFKKDNKIKQTKRTTEYGDPKGGIGSQDSLVRDERPFE